jgi:hypothetical protein
MAGIWRPQHVLAFGDSKSGKTELAGKLAERYKLHWFDLENGHTTLLKLPVEMQENITLYRIPDTRSYPVAIETMLKVITGIPVSICETHGKVSCEICIKAGAPAQRFALHELGENDIFVLDSGTQLGNSAMNNITSKQTDDYKPDWEDYRRQGFMLDRFLSNLQQGRYNAVVLTHTTMARMEDVQKTKLVPVMGTDNFSRNVAKYFDHIVYCDVGTGAHTFGSSTTYRPQILTGSRTDVAIERFEAPKLLPFFTGEIPPSKPDPLAAAMASLKSSASKAAELAAVKK